jgi:hypothetical protein
MSKPQPVSGMYGERTLDVSRLWVKRQRRSGRDGPVFDRIGQSEGNEKGELYGRGSSQEST